MTETKSNKPPEKARSFAVFVDTNTIHTHEKDILLFPEQFRAWWQDISQNGDVRLIIPELVYSELHQQKTKYYWDTYRKSLETVNSVIRKLDSTVETKLDALNQEKVKATIDKALWKQLKETPNCEISITPYSKIVSESIKTIIQNAVWRVPPFKNNREGEGFRDAIILETLKSFRAENPHTDIVFLSNDHALQDAAATVSSQEKNLQAFKDLAPVSAFINAARTKFTPEFLSKAILAAGEILKLPEESAFGKEIKDKIINDRSLKNGNLGFDRNNDTRQFPFPISYNCEGNPDFYVLDTTFLSVVGNDAFHWKTIIGVFCEYKKYSIPTLLTGFNVDDNSNKKVRQIMLNIEWESKVSKDVEFSELKLIELDVWSDEYRNWNDLYNEKTSEDKIDT